jgi:hypothetical protein
MTNLADALSSSDEKYLLCSRKDGMGARLANLLWTWRLARKVGARTLVFWPPMDEYYRAVAGIGDILDLYQLATGPIREELQIVDGRPADMFVPHLIDLNPRRACVPERYLVSPPGTYRARTPLPVLESSNGPLLMAGESKKAVAAEARELFARLPLRRRISKSLRVARKYHPKALVAVHVRRGDIVDILKTAGAEFTPAAREAGSMLDRYTGHFFRACAPLETYYRLLQIHLDRGETILLFSDTPEMEAPFVERFGDRVVLARALAPPTLTGLQQAMFELLLMSTCDVIIGTRSTFGLLASAAGNASFVDARQYTTPEEFIGAFQQAIEFQGLEADARTAVGEVVVRRLRENGFLKMWNTAEDDLLRLLGA